MPETATRRRKAKPPVPVVEPQRILELGNGLELWKVRPSALREQDVNARSMPKAMFERLSQTIGRDKRDGHQPSACECYLYFGRCFAGNLLSKRRDCHE